MDGERLKGTLDLLLLAVLADGPTHGYAVVARLRERSDGEFTLKEGTVYPALHRLERAGLLASGWTVGEGRRRRVYELSAAGQQALSAERAGWARFARGVSAVAGLA